MTFALLLPDRVTRWMRFACRHWCTLPQVLAGAPSAGALFAGCVAVGLTGCAGQRFEGGGSTAEAAESAPASASALASVGASSPALSSNDAPSSPPAVSLTADAQASAGNVPSSLAPSTEVPVTSASAFGTASTPSGTASDAGPIPSTQNTGTSQPLVDAGPPSDAGSCVGAGCGAVDCVAPYVLSPYGVCYFLGLTQRPFSDARAACLARGSGWDLLTIRTETEHLFASSDLLTSATWLGAQATEPEHAWQWVSDSLPFFIGTAGNGSAQNGAFTVWAPGEPSASISGEECLQYRRAARGAWAWARVSCSGDLEFICEHRGA